MSKSNKSQDQNLQTLLDNTKAELTRTQAKLAKSQGLEIYAKYMEKYDAMITAIMIHTEDVIGKTAAASVAVSLVNNTTFETFPGTQITKVSVPAMEFVINAI